MDKLRRLLLASPAVGLAGCASPALKSLTSALGSGTVQGAATARTPLEISQAAIAERAFQYWLSKKEVQIPAFYTQADVRTAKANYSRVVSALSSRNSLSISDSALLGTAISPLLMMLDQRGASNAKRTMPASRSAASFRDTTINIPPGGVVNLSVRGFCMDPGLPAPQIDEPFRLVPIDEKLLLPRLIPIYRALMIKVKTDAEVRYAAQGTIWLLRQAGLQRRPLAQVDRNMLNRIYPNGAAIYEQAVAVEGLLAPIRGLVGIANDLASLDLSNPKATAEHLAKLSAMKPPEAIPNDNSNFSMADDGLLVMGVGKSTLTPQLTIINASEQPRSLDLSRFAAVSPRSVQRTAMPAPDSISSKNFALVSDPNQVITGEQQRDILSMIGHDLELLGPKMAGFIPAMKGPLGRFLVRNAKNPAVKSLIESTPFLGNALSAYSLVSGKDWLTGEDLSPAEHVMNAFGTIPGSAQLTRLAGVSGLPKLAQWALSGSTAKNIGRVGDLVAPISDLGDYNEVQILDLIGADKAKEAVMNSLASSYNTFKKTTS